MKKIFVILIFVQLIVLVVLIFCFVYFPNTDIEATRKVLILNNYKPIYDAGASKLNGHFRQYGNIVMNGTANTSVYQFDRAFMYDPNVKYYRPPGLPVQPVLRLVREA